MTTDYATPPPPAPSPAAPGARSADAAVRAEDLVKTYGSTRALDGLDLSVPRGTVLGVLGPNGAGKTTAVRILATLLRPDAGTAVVAGHDVARDPDAVRRSIGLTGQYASVDEDLTGRENLVLIGRLLELSRRDARSRAAGLLEEFGLAEAGDRPAKTYSGGMRRRLDLAASLVGRPEVIFLDEPTTGLDPAKRDDVWAVVRTLVAEGTTVLLTTQYLEEAEALADSITVIDKGAVVAEGTPAQLKGVVGVSSVHVRPRDPSALPAVMRLLEAVTGRRPESPGRGVASAPADEQVLRRVLAELDREGIAVTEVALALPSLDEVFFALTSGSHATSTSEAAQS
ncbi:oleandomycin transport system ATP-binding protein [Motilibacter peucedani]|uniref:Oleandomycin transport system ATP-binding protein n=1 Tax=Motilibacter peucedani TaxID=598650 RepID=A0A420XMR4_9ACTN|nr:ATP-binding cassette domain-containing protein [Motilibacter peucedani]RKS72574.1 oleandomycin transport system ATP-binding protein [Motilibacter peucedani]